VSDIDIDVTDGIATVTIDRPPVNALDAQGFRDITAAFSGFRNRTDVRAAILTSSGGRAFCAGVDLNDSARRHSGGASATDANVADVIDPGRLVRECFFSVYDCAVPVIAAVNGAAIGAGLALVACCDVVFCADNARFALTEVDAGVLGGGRHLQRMVGSQFARRMMFTCDFVGAEEFYRRGCVEAVVGGDELLPAAKELAAKFAAKSPVVLRLAKESLNRVEFLPLFDGYRTEQDYTVRTTKFNDSAEARKAKLEKREPNYTWS
jgi:enoyl-CoA hydratase